MKCNFGFFLEEELLEAKLESEKALEGLRLERKELQEKIEGYNSKLGDEQWGELYQTIEEKSQRITELEKKLKEIDKKDSKICELEMEIDILQGEVSQRAMCHAIVCELCCVYFR